MQPEFSPIYTQLVVQPFTDILPLFVVLHEFSRLLQQRPEQFVRFDCILRKLTVLERVLIVLWRARSRRAPMHSTTLFAVHCRRPARLARAGLGSAALAGKHWAGIARVFVGHLRDLRSIGTGSAAASPTIVIGLIGEWLSAGGAAATLPWAVSRGA
jgi:hypothetical protein